MEARLVQIMQGIGEMFSKNPQTLAPLRIRKGAHD